MEVNLSKIGRVVRNFFFAKAGITGKAVQFEKRKSKLNSQLFVETLISAYLSDTQASLERMCAFIKEKGVKITKQGLHQRFNAHAVELMSQLLKVALSNFRSANRPVLDLLNYFSSVYQLDSSAVSLPESMKELFKGCGGNASESGLKLQVLFNYMQGEVKSLTFTDGRASDQGFREHLNTIEKGALYLQDLGYFRVDSFKKIANEGAYFLSRYLAPTTVYSEEGERIDLLKLLSNSGGYLVKKVWLGKTEGLQIRLIAHRLPDTEVEKRLRKLHADAKKKGRTPIEETLLFARWSIYITNAPESILADEHIHEVYTLRWQIELFFKLAKSEAGIDKGNGKKSNRILCELYAKLICVVLLLYLVFPERWQKNQEVSLSKACKQLQKYALTFFKALDSPYRFTQFLRAFLSDIKSFALKDRYRKKRRATYHKLMDAAGQEVFV